MPILPALTAAVIAAAPGPAVSPGWPVLGPGALAPGNPGTALVVAGSGGRVVAASVLSGELGEDAAGAWSGRGVRRWAVASPSQCGNCDGSVAPSQGGDGTVAMGVLSGGIFGVTTAGTLTEGCAGTLGPDADCYGRVFPGDGLVALHRGAVWTFADPALTDADGFRAPIAVFDDARAFMSLGGRLWVLDRATGALRWGRPAPEAGPVVTPDGTVVLGDGGSVAGHDPATGALRWSVPTGGTRVTSLVLDARRSRVLAGVEGPASAGVRRHRVEAVGQAGALTPVAVSPVPLRPLGATPDGTVLVGREAGAGVREAALVAIGPSGRPRWALRAAHGASQTIPAPYIAPNGTVFAGLGPLLYRLPGGAATAPGRRSRVLMSAARFRITGAGRPAAPQTCAADGSCTPRTPLGAVAQLRLPAGTPRQLAPMRITDGRGREVWRANADIAPGVTDVPITYGYPATLRTGPAVVSVRWRDRRGVTRRLAVPVSLVRG
jgi:hypothetical protein